jgi:hypothetical protein
MSSLELQTEDECDTVSGSLLGGSLLGGSTLSDSLLGGSFLPVLEEIEKPKLWGNYRGSRYLIIKEEGALMTLSKTMVGDTLLVSSCNVSDVSSSSTTAEKVCPGNNQCRKKGLRQGDKCEPIRPSEGILHYPHPI